VFPGQACELLQYDYHKSHTIPAVQEKPSGQWVRMMRNMSVLGMVSHLIARKNHVENVSGAGVRNGTWHEKKVHRRKHMDHQMILGDTGSENDIHHRETAIAIIK